MIWNTIIDILLVFVFGINAFFLIKMTKRQSQLIDDQNKIIENQQKDLKFIQGLADETRDMYQEREKLIEEKGRGQQELLKDRYETEIKQRKEAINSLWKEFIEAYGVLWKLAFVYGHLPQFEEYMQEMDSPLIKDRLLAEVKKNKQDYEARQKTMGWLNQIILSLHMWQTIAPQKGDKNT